MIYVFEFCIKQKVIVTDYDGTIWPNCVVLERRLEEKESALLTEAELVETYKVLVFDDKLTKKSQACDFPVNMIKKAE